MGVLGFFAPSPDAPLIADPARVDSLYRRHRLAIIIAITLGYGFSYTCRLALGVVKKPLIDGGIFSPMELGQIDAALFYAYAFGKLTNGALADHVNVRRLFVLGLAVSAACNIAMDFSTGVVAAAVIWGVNGWFQSFGAPSAVVSMTQWFSNHERGRYYGIWSTAHSIGEGLTFVGVGALVTVAGWRAGFLGPGVLGLLVAGACYVVLRDRPQSLGLPPVAVWRNDHYAVGPKAGADDALRSQLSILRIPEVWALALSSALIYVTRYAINSWGVLYLQEARGYSLPAASTMLLISTLAGVAGAVAYGFISDNLFKARRPPANLLFGLLELVGLGLLFYGPDTPAVMVIAMLLFGLGMTGLVTSLGGLFATDICPKRAAGAAMGLIGVFSYLGAAIQEQVTGSLIQQGMTMVKGVRRYDFHSAELFWMGASVASLVLATALWNAKLRE